MEGAELVPVDAALPDSMRSWAAPAIDLAALYPGLAAAGDLGPRTPPAAPSSQRNGNGAAGQWQRVTLRLPTQVTGS